MKQGTQIRCSSATQRYRVGRTEGGRLRIGGTYIPVADSCWCMAKTINILLSNYLPIKIKKLKIRVRKGYTLIKLLFSWLVKHGTERSPLSPQFLQWERELWVISNSPRIVGHTGSPDSGFAPRYHRGTFGTHPLGIWLWQKEGGSSKSQHVNLDRLCSYLQRPSGGVYQQLCSSTRQSWWLDLTRILSRYKSAWFGF